jgi:tetratricopeptide (TPR) repeat protein
MLEENIKEVAKALKAEGAEGKAAAVALLLKVQGSGDIKDRIKSLTTARRYDEALKACDDGLAINPRDAWIMKEKGVALVLLGRPLEGIKCFDRLIASFPHIGYGWYAKGLALCELGKREEGFECFKKAEALGSEEAKLALRHYQGQSR